MKRQRTGLKPAGQGAARPVKGTGGVHGLHLTTECPREMPPERDFISESRTGYTNEQLNIKSKKPELTGFLRGKYKSLPGKISVPLMGKYKSVYKQ